MKQKQLNNFPSFFSNASRNTRPRNTRMVNPANDLGTCMEGNRPLALCPKKTTCLVYLHSNSKLSRNSTNYLLAYPQKKIQEEKEITIPP